MILKCIELKNYRNIEKTEYRLCDGVNLICGDNAQGKTNILEAIYIFARGRAFRAKKDSQVIRFGADSAYARIEYDDGRRVCGMSCRYVKDVGKKLTYNGIEIKKSSEFIGKFRAVLFSPDSLSLIRSSPSERRLFMDVGISQLNAEYVSCLKKYKSLLHQRNALIKEPDCDRGLLYILSEQMSDCCADISRYRYDYLTKINGCVREIFTQMSDDKEKTKLIYSPEGIDTEKTDMQDREALREKFYTLLTENVEREQVYKTTLYGVHRDDFDIYLNGKSAKLYCSQGQVRSLALAMKLSEGKISELYGNTSPVYLLDDVFGELDENRRRFILNKLDGMQVVITSCEKHDGMDNVVYVKEGAVSEQLTDYC